MKFEVGKYYKHTIGHTLAILGYLETTMWGKTLIAESNQQGQMTELVAVGSNESAIANYREITKEEWMENYS